MPYLPKPASKKKDILNQDFPVPGVNNLLPTKDMMSLLLELGLNKYESMVYLTLVSEGISTAKNISDITSIPYGKVYEIINLLSSKGFVALLPSKPMKCQAVSPREAVEMTKDKQQDKFRKLEKQLLKELEPVFAETRKFTESKSSFLVINGRANVNNKIEELIAKAKKQIRILVSENGLKRLVIHKEPLLEAKARNVELQICSRITKDNHEDACSMAFCQLKHASEMASQLFLFDNKEALMIEPVPDDDNIMYGRDIGVWIASDAFAKLLEHSFTANYKQGRFFNLGNGQ